MHVDQTLEWHKLTSQSPWFVATSVPYLQERIFFEGLAMSEETKHLVYIWSDQHKAYWRPKAQGYTAREVEAGVWPRQEAVAMTKHCGPEKKIGFFPAAATPEAALAREKWTKSRSDDGDMQLLRQDTFAGAFRIRWDPAPEGSFDGPLGWLLSDRPSMAHEWLVERKQSSEWGLPSYEVTLDDAVSHCDGLISHYHELQKLDRRKLDLKGSETPWGACEEAVSYGEGVISYSTARHGGFWVSPERQAKMPPALYRDTQWYEEDCEQALVTLSFQELFTSYEISAAEETLKRYFPDRWERHYGQLLEDDHAQNEILEMSKHDLEPLLVMSAVEDPNDPSMVRVVAALNGDPSGGTRVFLVPAQEFDCHEDENFIVDPDRHEEVDADLEPDSGPRLN